MSNFFNFANIRTGVQSKVNKFDESCQNLTTQDFYKVKPVYIKEMMPGESVKINVNTWSRLSPLINPMLGSAQIVTRAFFVPMRVAWRHFNAFLNETSEYHNGTLQSFTEVPKVTNATLYQLFTINENSFGGSTADANPDFTSISGSVKVKRQFTPLGKLKYDILLNLGYSINFTSDDNTSFSALPIFAYAKIWLEWLRNPAYTTGRVVESYLDAGSGFILGPNELNSILNNLIQVVYHWDYFTSAFDKPMMPNTGEINTHQINVVDSPSSGQNVRNTQSQTPYVTSGSNLTQFGLDALKSLTDYVKRIQLTGTRIIDRYFGNYGVKLSNEILNRPSYLGKMSSPLQISDVMQTSTNFDSNDGVGDYAGKGVSQGHGNFEYKTDEFGYFILISYVEPRSTFVQGVNRFNMHLNSLDFFQGDFDSLGYQAISKNELFADYKGDQYSGYCSAKGYSPTSVFGYTPRYAEYACKPQDTLSGDFRIPSRNASYESWNLFRLIDNDLDIGATLSDVGQIVHDEDFCLANGSTYDRIFADRGSNLDHFFTIFTFIVESYKPKKRLFEGYEFDPHGDAKTVQINGTNIHD